LLFQLRHFALRIFGYIQHKADAVGNAAFAANQRYNVRFDQHALKRCGYT